MRYMPPSAISLFGLNLDSFLSLSGNTADDHDTFCSAFLEEKIEGRQALQKAVWIPQQISLLHFTTRSGLLHLHIVGTRLAVVYILIQYYIPYLHLVYVLV